MPLPAILDTQASNQQHLVPIGESLQYNLMMSKYYLETWI